VAKRNREDLNNQWIMMDFYEDQTNLVIVNWSDEQNGYRLNNKNREISFILE